MPNSAALLKWAKEKTQSSVDKAQVKLASSDTGKRIKSFLEDGSSSTTTRPQSSSTKTSSKTSTTSTSNGRIPPTTSSSTNRPQTTTTKTSTSSTSIVPASQQSPTFDGCAWNVPGIGKFSYMKNITFEDGMSSDLQVSSYKVDDSYAGAPYDHQFYPENVYVDDGLLCLKVPGQPDLQPDNNDTISSAEVITTVDDMKYCVVESEMAFDTIPGVCHGMFFYKNDQQEIDIEYLTDPQSQANNINTNCTGGDPIPIWYSNQAVVEGTDATQNTGPVTGDPTEFHTYRIVWTKYYTAFYVDGVFQYRYYDNVPSMPGSFIWNNWANGDTSWSAGPPQQDNILRIKRITMYYNTATQSADTC